MREKVFELLNQGKDADEIHRLIGLSKRQVLRYKAQWRRPTKPIRTRKDLLDLLREKAEQGDFRAVKELLRADTWEKDEEEHLKVTSARFLFTECLHCLTGEERAEVLRIFERAGSRTKAEARAVGLEGDPEKFRQVVEQALEEGPIPEELFKATLRHEEELLEKNRPPEERQPQSGGGEKSDNPQGEP